MNNVGAHLRGMILAAGYGTRLAPLTDYLPKPLLPVGGMTLLDHAIAVFDTAGIKSIGVNTHHLGEQVADHLYGRSDAHRFCVLPEAEILGTGGALYGAREFLGQADHFVIHNGDVLCPAPLGDMVATHVTGGALATLLLVDWPVVNSVAVDTQGAICRLGGNSPADDPTWRHLTYTGIGIFRNDLLDHIGPGFSSLIDPLVRAKNNQPGCVRGFAPEGLVWSDLGTPARYLAAVQTGEVSPQGKFKVEPITGHGSERRFWRMSGADFSLIAMVSPQDDPEFGRYAEIGAWLESEGLGAPKLHAINPAEKSVLMEDVGQVSLFSRAKEAAGQASELRPHYELVVDHLLLLQSRTPDARAACPAAVDRVLDHDQLRWETDYFRERFLVGHLGFEAGDLALLTPEFEDLARVVACQPLVLIHRDFQSQNIHLQGGQVRLVDFQGLRLGPLGYDIMSLVMDPYVDMPGSLQAELLDKFCHGAEGTHTALEIRAMVVAAGLQRVMQALGAFGFLGHVKDKPAFLDHIPRAVTHLKSLLGEHAVLLENGGTQEQQWLPGGLVELARLPLCSPESTG